MQNAGIPALAPDAETPPRRGVNRRLGCALAIIALALVLTGLFVVEGRTSYFQARLFSKEAAHLTYHLAPGASDSVFYPEGGPMDVRRGYALIPEAVAKLEQQGYRVTSQARMSARHLELCRRGIYPIYHEKSKAGLLLYDASEDTLYAAAFPQRYYRNYDSIPRLVRESLLFIENRELLNVDRRYRNPAVEWDRLGKATLDFMTGLLDPHHPQPGGSTLATQIEKFSHSPGGRTSSAREKLRQMISASLRAYLDGPDTRAARKDIVLEYVNQVPLAAVPGYGEVIGLGDALWAWYGADFDRVNRLLEDPDQLEGPELAAAGLAMKQALSLFVAQRRPSESLTGEREKLVADTDRYLRLLGTAGILSPKVRDAALAQRLSFRSPASTPIPTSFVDRKAANAIRTRLLNLLDLKQLYALDRIDLIAKTTLDGDSQAGVAHIVRDLTDPQVAGALGLYGEHLLAPDRRDVIYSFTLYEVMSTENVLRVQVDNWNQPLDINEGTKLDLGSTAKLRTLIYYLEIIAKLHAAYAGQSSSQLRHRMDPEASVLRNWALDYLSSASDTSLAAMLEAAMQRQYSSSTGEVFFTGGGQHTFVNLDKSDDNRSFTVEGAFRESINLVFIRLMRDVVRFTREELPGFDPAMLKDLHHPARRAYLERFAEKEGKEYLAKFYPKYQGKNGLELLRVAGDAAGRDKRRLAVVFRSVKPSAPPEDLERYLIDRLGTTQKLKPGEARTLYDTYGPDKFDMHDRGYIAHLHPLELWLVTYLEAHPGASWSEVVDKSKVARVDAYKWLFTSKSRDKQNTRIQIMLEDDAFRVIHQAWRQLGYPFDSLVPSYATSIGSSGDRPAALADLMGILVRDGVRVPSGRLGQLDFARGTPFETVLDPERVAGQRVLPVEIAHTVKRALEDVVQNGTARRVRGAFVLADGTPLQIGGKTGTGDHRFDTFDRRGLLIESRVVNRAGTFVFFIGDRYFGTVTAYVPGPRAADYHFTSALTVQILAKLAPELLPMMEKRGFTKPEGS
jgi:membrane peptidoglycan carboxypeptidase